MVYKILLLSAIITYSYAKNFDDLSECPVKIGPSRNDCVVRFLNKIKPHLKNGIKDLRMSSYDPLVFPRLDIEHSSTELAMIANLSNLSFHNFTNYDVTSYNQDETTVREIVIFSDILLTTYFILNATFLNFPLVGRGNLSANIPAVKANSIIKYETTMVGDVTRCHIVDAKVNFNMNDVYVNARGLAGGDIANQFLNANSRAVAKEMGTVIAKIFEENAKSSNKNVCKKNLKVPISAFFS